MEIYLATSDYVADISVVNSKVLNVSEGQKFEILEQDGSTRHHQEWWGVRNLVTGKVGYVPAKYLQFAERIPEEELPLDHKAQRERQLRQLDTMQQEDEAPLPDIYKVPPVQVQSIDEWTNADDADPRSVNRDPLCGVPRSGSPYRDQPPHYGPHTGVVLRPKQEKTKSVKTRKSFIDRIFGSKHKDKDSKKEKKKGKVNPQIHTDHIRTESPSSYTVPSNNKEPSHFETQELKLTVIDDGPEDKSESEEESGDSKENEPPSGSEEGAHAMKFPDNSDDDSLRDNNNRSMTKDEWERLVDDVENDMSTDRKMTEDEWKKLVDGIENDMDFPDPPEPEIDYPDEDNENDVPNGSTRIIQPALGSLEDLPKYLKPASSQEKLVEPKKLPNPVVSSRLHQDLHREMESNRRMGVDVLHRKTELKKEFERREDRLKKKEREEYEKKKKTEIQKRLEEQKQKYDELEKTGKEKEPEVVQDESNLSEFQRMRSKIYSNKAS